MNNRSRPSQLLTYFGVIATGLTVVVVGLAAVVQASADLSQSAAREKTNLEMQIESSREIRKALAVKIVTPPLAPITARVAHAPDVMAPKNVARATLSEEARTAMAMDQNELGPSSSYRYPTIDRHAAY